MVDRLVSVDEEFDLPDLVVDRLEETIEIFRGSTTLYINASVGNDGFSGVAGAPLKTIAEAIRRAESQAQERDSVFTISLGAGTYSEQVRFSEFTSQNLSILLTGPNVGEHPNQPSVIFTEGSNAASSGIVCRNPNLTLVVRDIRFVGYRGSTSASGINSIQSNIYCVNVHTSQCFYGVSSQHGFLDVKGGVFDDNGRLSNGTGTGAAVRSLMLNRHSIGTQNAGNLSAGPIFTNNRYGFYAQESSSGHVDWCTFDDNERGVVVRVNSRANVDGSSFRRNGWALSADSNAHVYVSGNVTFGTGTNANTRTISTLSGAEVTTNRMITDVEMALSRVPRALTGIYTQQTVTGTTGIVDVLNRTLKAPFWNDVTDATLPPRRLLMRAVGRLNGTADTKTVHLRLGGSFVSATFTSSDVGAFLFEGEILFVSPTRQVMSCDARRHLNTTVRLDQLTVNTDLTVDQQVRVTGQVASAADSIVVESVELSWA